LSKLISSQPRIINGDRVGLSLGAAVVGTDVGVLVGLRVGDIVGCEFVGEDVGARVQSEHVKAHMS